MGIANEEVLGTLVQAVRARLGEGMLVLGICGAQGSGKSTLSDSLAARLRAEGVPASILSIDDLYLTLDERRALARDVHPLLLTRGVPGTHDVALGLSILAELDAGRQAMLPRFDKARDDRMPRERWQPSEPGLRVLIFEGWCVGARPEPMAALALAVNRLEQEEDADGRWRGFVNDALAGEYQRLFGRIDIVALLAAPSFATVFRWRDEQEQGLRARSAPGAMTPDEVRRFVLHYERVTRHILAEMPGRADVVIHLDEDRRPISGV